MGAMGVAEIGVVGIVGLAVVLGSLGMSVAARMTCKVIREIYWEMTERQEKEDL